MHVHSICIPHMIESRSSIHAKPQLAGVIALFSRCVLPHNLRALPGREKKIYYDRTRLLRHIFTLSVNQLNRIELN